MIRSLRRGLVALTCLAVAAGPGFAQGNPGTPAVQINGTYNALYPPAIAVMPIVGANGDSVQAILARDLFYSDRFNVVPIDGSDPRVFRDTGSAGGLNYAMFRALKVRLVVQATLTTTGLHVALHRADSGSVIMAKEFLLPGAPLSRDWRMALHATSDAVEEWVTGQPGIAATRIVYVAGRGVIRLIDSDGWGDRAATPSDTGFGPAWSPDGRTIAYYTIGKTPGIVTTDLATGHSRPIVSASNYEVGGPHFTPAGDTLVYFRDDGNVSELWAVSASGTGSHRIIGGLPDVNAELSFSPDGRKIAFTSGRAGRPEVYIMDADGTNPDMLTSILPIDDKTDNAEPAWSPDGLRVAFSSMKDGKFQLMTINRRDQSAKQLTADGENKHPSWSPDARHLVFSSDRSGEQELWVLDCESFTMRQLTRGAGEPRTPSWSPRLQAGP